MGYTHSIHRPLELDPRRFKLFAQDVRTMAEAIAPEVAVRGGDGTGEPRFSNDLVEFNGSAERGEDCEPFRMTRGFHPELGQRDRGGKFFAHCKTEHKPYDVLVVAACFALIHHCPEAEFHSDGPRESLRPGLDLFGTTCRLALNGRNLIEEAVCPR